MNPIPPKSYSGEEQLRFYEEIWVCSGQSNMAFPLARAYNRDLEAAASILPAMRLIRMPNVVTQELLGPIVEANERVISRLQCPRIRLPAARCCDGQKQGLA